MKTPYRTFGSPMALLGLLAPFVCTGCGAEASSGDTAPPADTGETGEEQRGIFNTPYGPQELTYQLINGERVYQGDIILPPEEVDFRSSGVSGLGARWPNAIVRIDSSAGFVGNLFQDPRVTSAIQHWEDRTPVRFVSGVVTGNRVRFVRSSNATQCDSAFGMAGGVQVVNLGDLCSTALVRHELGHVMGLHHEHARTDRNDYVRVIPECIQPGLAQWFNIFGSGAMNIGPYDISSIMHYSSTAGLDLTKIKDGCFATITRTDGTTFSSTSLASPGDIAGIQALYLAWWLRMPAVDWDHDRKADFAVWRPSNGTWFIRNSSNDARSSRGFGRPTDVPVPADYDHDLKADHAVWRPGTGEWFVIQSRTNTVVTHQWGALGDIPVPGDYTGDGVIDRAVWRPSDATWYVLTNNSATQFGETRDIPVPGDYDHDFITDFAVWRPRTGVWWVIESSTGNWSEIEWGVPGDIPVHADYDGDGFTDRAVWRPEEGTWFILNSSTGFSSVMEWGVYDDVPVPGDYDGDGRADMAVWRPSNGNWYVVSSRTGASSVTQYGAVGDSPVP